MKKYLVILTVLLLGKAEAQKAYPKIKNDTATNVAYHGDLVTITRTGTRTVIDSEITVPTSIGRIIRIPTKLTECTTVLSQRTLTVSREVSAKFGDMKDIIDDYLMYGKQTADPGHLISLKRGFLKISYVLYIKNDVLHYQRQYAFSVNSVIIFALFCMMIVFMFSMTVQFDSSYIRIILVMGMGIVLGLVMTDNRLYVWDEALVPVSSSIAIFFATKWLMKLYQTKKLKQMQSVR